MDNNFLTIHSHSDPDPCRYRECPQVDVLSIVSVLLTFPKSIRVQAEAPYWAGLMRGVGPILSCLLPISLPA